MIADTNLPESFLLILDQAVHDRAGRKQGNEILFRCPFPGHEDTHPSARWNATKGIFYCDVCDKGGGSLALAGLLNIE